MTDDALDLFTVDARLNEKRFPTAMVYSKCQAREKIIPNFDVPRGWWLLLYRPVSEALTWHRETSFL
jgi:hypothetical protein